jgi:hypothetical protein
MKLYAVCAAKHDMEPANCLDLPCQLLLGQKIALIAECSPHLLQIEQHGPSMGINADLDCARAVCRLFPRVYLGPQVYLGHFLPAAFASSTASSELYVLRIIGCAHRSGIKGEF